MLNEPSHLPQEYARPNTQAQETFLRAVASQQMGVPPSTQAPLPVPVEIRRPGCVTATAIVISIFGAFEALGGLASLVTFDLLLCLSQTSFAFLMVGLCMGLWNMNRWAANLTIMFCASNILRLVLSCIVAIILSDNYPDTLVIDTLVFAYVFAAIMGSLIFSLVLHWFWKTRRWFLPTTAFAESERNFYRIAAMILLFHVLVEVVSIPQVYEYTIQNPPTGFQ